MIECRPALEPGVALEASTACRKSSESGIGAEPSDPERALPFSVALCFPLATLLGGPVNVAERGRADGRTGGEGAATIPAPTANFAGSEKRLEVLVVVVVVEPDPEAAPPLPALDFRALLRVEANGSRATHSF